MLSLVALAQSCEAQAAFAALVFLYVVFIRKNSFGVSVIEKTQKEAHANEMDHSNTSPVVFALISALQFIVVAGVSLLWLDAYGSFTVVGVTAIISHVTGFTLSLLTGTDMYFDLTGEVTFAIVLVYSYFSISVPSARQNIAFALSAVWVTRLGYFLFARILRRGGRDWRFDKLVKGRMYNLFGWVSQGTWVWLQGFCLWSLAGDKSGEAASALGGTDYIGIIIFFAGFACEAIADEQKSAWNKRNRFGHDQQTTWIQEGLWRYSRHPNFFGEMLLWVGLSLVAMGGTTDGIRISLAMVSPVWSCFFLLFTSLMLLEKRLDKRFDSYPDYPAYKRQTSVLIPWVLNSA